MLQRVTVKGIVGYLPSRLEGASSANSAVAAGLRGAAADFLNRTPRPPSVSMIPSRRNSTPMLSKAAHKLGQGIDVAANDVLARLHSLNGWKRQSRQFRQLALIQAGERARRTKLSRSNHVKTISYALIYVIYNAYGIDMSNARKFVSFRENPTCNAKAENGLLKTSAAKALARHIRPSIGQMPRAQAARKWRRHGPAGFRQCEQGRCRHRKGAEGRTRADVLNRHRKAQPRLDRLHNDDRRARRRGGRYA